MLLIRRCFAIFIITWTVNQFQLISAISILSSDVKCLNLKSLNLPIRSPEYRTNPSADSINRRLIYSIITTFCSLISPTYNFDAYARNIPESNGATGKLTGTTQALFPIISMSDIINDANIICSEDLNLCKERLDKLPLDERNFKRLFDEYSVGISYRQQYLDKNAFVVYYSKGFDGPGRTNIEDDDDQTILQKRQYGARNDAWFAVDDAKSEVSYLLTHEDDDRSDLVKAMQKAHTAFEEYLSLAPKEQVVGARLLQFHNEQSDSAR